MFRKSQFLTQLSGVMLVATALSFCACGEVEEQSVQEPEEITEDQSVQEPENVTEEQSVQEAEGNTEEEDNSYYEEYLSVINETTDVEWDGFTLVDLDGDGADDLVCTCTNEQNDSWIMFSLQPYMIVFGGAEGIEKYDGLEDGVASAGGYRGNLYYLSGTRMIYDCAVYAPYGAPQDTIFLLENGQMSEAGQGYFLVNEDEIPTEGSVDILEYGEWKWNGEMVAKEQYEQNMNQLLGDHEKILLSGLDYLDRDAMTEALSSKIK